MTDVFGTDRIARDSGISAATVRLAVRLGEIAPPDLSRHPRAWLWTESTAREAIAILKLNHRGRPCAK